ncbi:MAG: PrsW family intramembrane metalloprotease [Anaerolineae bacterium]|nr:PrsW family intramembrane metalloprotease [Thermoflexales bacterium]MDW8395098.1 PrsW family intramembrane metalloprotease [Anaerolineae bacterium]
MPLPLSALLIALPTLLYARWVRNIDHFEKEPPKYVAAAFLWGAVPAALLALILQLTLSVPTLVLLGEEGSDVILSVIYAPVTEELVKGLAVAFLYFWRRREFDGWVDGIVYGATVGFGFAYVENILYLANTETLGDWVELFFLRVIVFGFLHGFYTSLIGIGFGLARYAPTDAHKLSYIAGGFAAAIVTHAIHNGSLVLAGAVGPSAICGTLLNYALLFGLLLSLRFVSRRNDQQMFKTYLADEVPSVLPPQVYDALCALRLSALPQPRAAFLQAAAELAQRKKQYVRHGEIPSPDEIASLRATLSQMCARTLRETQ